MSQTEPSRTQKSTTVRSIPLPLRAMATGLRVVETCSPKLAATLGVKLMFQTRRGSPSEAERGVMDRGAPFAVQSHGKSIAAWSFGEGPTVLLVHGWNGRGGQLGSLVEPLVSRGFRVVTFDAPGHGQSDGSSASLIAFADAVDDVIAASASLFSPLQAIIAHSMGGAAVTYAMSRYLDSNQQSASNERALREELPARRFVLLAAPIDLRDFVRGFSRAVGLHDRTRARMERRIETKLALTFDQLYGPRLAEDLRAPLLVVHDADDREVPVKCGQLLAGAWPGAELLITHGLGHKRILRDPEVVDRVVSFATA